MAVCNLAALALAGNGPPGKNFSLTNWYLTLPVDGAGGTSGTASNVSAAQLVAGYTNRAYFYTASDGAMVFNCPANGATTSGSSNPRTELREQLNTNDNSVDWTASGMNVLTAQCKVTAVAQGGEVAIAQVHAYSVDIPLVILRYDNTQDRGTVAATVKYRTDGNPVNGETDNVLTFTNLGLNSLINYRVALGGGVVHITVNGITRSQNIYATDTNWARVNFYFKAGDYYLNNGGTTDASQISFYALSTSHGPMINGVIRSGSKLIGYGGGGPASSNYYVLYSTNLMRAITNWTAVATDKFDSAGNFRFTNSAGSNRQNFFTIKLR